MVIPTLWQHPPFCTKVLMEYWCQCDVSYRATLCLCELTWAPHFMMTLYHIPLQWMGEMSKYQVSYPFSIAMFLPLDIQFCYEVSLVLEFLCGSISITQKWMPGQHDSSCSYWINFSWTICTHVKLTVPPSVTA